MNPVRTTNEFRLIDVLGLENESLAPPSLAREGSSSKNWKESMETNLWSSYLLEKVGKDTHCGSLQEVYANTRTHLI